MRGRSLASRDQRAAQGRWLCSCRIHATGDIRDFGEELWLFAGEKHQFDAVVARQVRRNAAYDCHLLEQRVWIPG